MSAVSDEIVRAFGSASWDHCTAQGGDDFAASGPDSKPSPR